MTILLILAYLLVGLGIFRFMNWLTDGVKFIEHSPWPPEDFSQFEPEHYYTPLSGFTYMLVWPVLLFGIVFAYVFAFFVMLWEDWIPALWYKANNASAFDRFFGLK